MDQLNQKRDSLKYFAIGLILCDILIKGYILLMIGLTSDVLIIAIILSPVLLIPDVILLKKNIYSDRNINSIYLAQILWAAIPTIGLLTFHFWLGFMTVLAVLVAIIYIIFYTQPVWKEIAKRGKSS